MKVTSFFVTVVSLLLCFSPDLIAKNLQNAIVPVILNGQPIVDESDLLRMTVQIIGLRRGNNAFECSGTIIGERKILTAAHCLPRDLDQIVIRFFADESGKFIWETTGRYLADPDYHVAGAVPMSGDMSYHGYAMEQFMSMAENDIGVITLGRNIPASARIANLLADSRLIRNGGMVKVAGYGLRDDRDIMNVVSDPLLQVADLQLYRVDQDVAALKPTNGFPALGDSGGPAYMMMDGQIYVFGVMSSGTSRGGWDVVCLVSSFGDFLGHAIER